MGAAATAALLLHSRMGAAERCRTTCPCPPCSCVLGRARPPAIACMPMPAVQPRAWPWSPTAACLAMPALTPRAWSCPLCHRVPSRTARPAASRGGERGQRETGGGRRASPECGGGGVPVVFGVVETGKRRCFEYIEDIIQKQEPIETVIRLLVLFSLTNAGLPKKNFDYLRREILHSYGFEHMPLLYNLEKAGLVKRQESRSNWVGISRALQLIVDIKDPEKPPDDISYIFSGYAPLSIRLDQYAVRVGHRSLVLVVFIGGVTSAEIAALRFLSAQEGMGYDFLVATTKVITGNTLLRPIIASSKEGL
ncbi:hypothetical protein ACQ4PT_072054 [Festuca glaucescens]